MAPSHLHHLREREREVKSKSTSTSDSNSMSRSRSILSVHANKRLSRLSSSIEKQAAQQQQSVESNSILLLSPTRNQSVKFYDAALLTSVPLVIIPGHPGHSREGMEATIIVRCGCWVCRSVRERDRDNS